MADQDIYFDNNATTPTLVSVRLAMIQALEELCGNASSAHSAGARSRNAIQEARRRVARLMNADEDGICFTSGGTEANNLALLSVLARPEPRRVITTEIEHSSVLRACDYLQARGVEVVYLTPDPRGQIGLDDLAQAISSARATLVSVQWVNNETGVIQPMTEISELCKEHGVPLHSDAAQAAGKVEINVERLPIDLVTLTAHKIHGPQGVGALWARRRDFVTPSSYGGPQEDHLRAGTENLAGIVGFGVAAAHRIERQTQVENTVRQLRDHFEAVLKSRIDGIKINGCLQDRVANSTNVRFPGVDGQALVAQLDGRGIYCSQSSACTNHRPEPSYVLRAMGLSEAQAFESVRFSFSELNTQDEINRAVDHIAETVGKLRALTGYSDQTVSAVGAVS